MPAILPFLTPAACVLAAYLLGVRRSRLAGLHLESQAAARRRAEQARTRAGA